MRIFLLWLVLWPFVSAVIYLAIHSIAKSWGEASYYRWKCRNEEEHWQTPANWRYQDKPAEKWQPPARWRF